MLSIFRTLGDDTPHEHLPVPWPKSTCSVGGKCQNVAAKFIPEAHLSSISLPEKGKVMMGSRKGKVVVRRKEGLCRLGWIWW